MPHIRGLSYAEIRLEPCLDPLVSVALFLLLAGLFCQVYHSCFKFYVFLEVRLPFCHRKGQKGFLNRKRRSSGEFFPQGHIKT